MVSFVTQNSWMFMQSNISIFSFVASEFPGLSTVSPMPFVTNLLGKTRSIWLFPMLACTIVGLHTNSVGLLYRVSLQFSLDTVRIWIWNAPPRSPPVWKFLSQLVELWKPRCTPACGCALNGDPWLLAPIMLLVHCDVNSFQCSPTAVSWAAQRRSDGQKPRKMKVVLKLVCYLLFCCCEKTLKEERVGYGSIAGGRVFRSHTTPFPWWAMKDIHSPLSSQAERMVF